MGGADTLIAAARTGDEAAWAELYRRHAGRLELWLRWLPASDAAVSAEDVAAQAWLTAAGKVHDFSGSDDDFAGWLFGIARKHALNDYRRGVRRRTSPAELDSGAQPVFGVPGDDLSPIEGQDTVRRLLGHLSPREAEVVVCLDVVGLDVAATAEALGLRTTAVRVAHHRALTRLRRLMADDAPGEPTPEPQG
ncbi:sigma-70 family RNA polymerase sigma factor [Nocardioides anomalus]|uniref:Sigma-70 family RNA polymerase sigma factor n=1 Tax=Nocardioides anomalus TaxID=2712223 RepID=A0A6G6WK73_9ACTN|nr:sigma-70 family RNA polymerase sigma factor [Nocardioides anomalus]QIG45557.1 sigma-70 family RNA polymerase sigma factor [Nocardioides anomalus]